MKNSLIILILILFQTVNGQNNVDKLKTFLKTVNETDSLKEKIKTAKLENLEILEVYVELERDIDFGYKHHRMTILHLSGWDLKLNFISKNGRIEFGWISEYQLNKDKHLQLKQFKSSPVLMKEYLTNHNKFYGTNLNKTEFQNQIITEYVIGFGCGSFNLNDVEKDFKKGFNSKKLDKLKNRKYYRNWLKSFSPEIQTYGAIGLLSILDKYKISITEEEKRIINHLKQRNSIIMSCSGCLVGLEETFKERIKYYEIEASR